VVHRRLSLPGDRSLVREIAAKSALDLVRRTLAH
jgi:nicotinamide mononucleotide (NMN) deamidase PncC